VLVGDENSLSKPSKLFFKASIYWTIFASAPIVVLPPRDDVKLRPVEMTTGAYEEKLFGLAFARIETLSPLTEKLANSNSYKLTEAGIDIAKANNELIKAYYERELLGVIYDHPNASLEVLAKANGRRTEKGELERLQRDLERMAGYKPPLVEKLDRGYKLTEEGDNEMITHMHATCSQVIW